jgi:hypothetical protein
VGTVALWELPVRGGSSSTCGKQGSHQQQGCSHGADLQQQTTAGGSASLALLVQSVVVHSARQSLLPGCVPSCAVLL